MSENCPFLSYKHAYRDIFPGFSGFSRIQHGYFRRLALATQLILSASTSKQGVSHNKNQGEHV